MIVVCCLVGHKIQKIFSNSESDQWEVVEEFEVEGLDEVSTSLGSMESGISSEISKFITREGIEVQILQGNIESTNVRITINTYNQIIHNSSVQE